MPRRALNATIIIATIAVILTAGCGSGDDAVIMVCGGANCNAKTHYCLSLTAKSTCVPLPAQCNDCTCLKADASKQSSDCDNNGLFLCSIDKTEHRITCG